MNLDNRTERSQVTKQLLGKKVKELEALLKELHDRRYYNYEIEVESYYRLVSHIYLSKIRNGSSLIFHLKNFLG